MSEPSRSIRPGDLVAVADGAGVPSPACMTRLSDAARDAGDVSLLLGWCLDEPKGLDLAAFSRVMTVMGGYGLRGAQDAGLVEYLPVRLGSMPARLTGPLRPDVLVLSLIGRGDELRFGTEVGWAWAASKVARTVLVEERVGGVVAAERFLPRRDVTVLGETDAPPVTLPTPVVDELAREIAHRVAAMIPEGSAVQVGPGKVAQAVLDTVAVPISIDSGVVIDAVMAMDQRGLLLGAPTATYLAGSADLYNWAEGRALLREVEYTHDVSRLSERPLYAVNSALEIDLYGQVNVEIAGGRPLAGVGGHPDYALAASRSGGASIVALPTERAGQSTLVEKLDVPTSTTRQDVDFLVTERGAVDLRGLSDTSRRGAIAELWNGAVRTSLTTCGPSDPSGQA